MAWQPPPMELRCVLLGAGVMTVIPVELDAHIPTVKTLVKKAFPELIACDASQLTLYRAWDGAEWVATGSATANAILEKGPISDVVKALLIHAVDDCGRMNNVGAWPVDGNFIHVLVRLPDPPAPTWFVNYPNGEPILNVAALIAMVIFAVFAIKELVDEPDYDNNKGLVYFARLTLIFMIVCVFIGYAKKMFASPRASTGI